MNKEIRKKKWRLLDSMWSGRASHTRFWMSKPCLGFPAALGKCGANRKEMFDRGESPKGKHDTAGPQRGPSVS